MEQQTDRPIYKRWYFWVVIGLIIAAGLFVAWKSNKNVGKTDDQKSTSSQPQGALGYSYDASLPDCPADLSGVLDHEIFDMADLGVVIPLGNLGPGVHTIPTDHMYIDHLGLKRMAIYAPGDMTLISMDNKITYDLKTDAKLRDDWSIQFALCKGLTIYLNHFSELEPKVKTAFDNSKQLCETQNKIRFGVSEMYYMPCQSQFMLPFKSGELIGYIGSFAGGGKDPDVIGIDLGAYNYNSTPHAMANPSRYSEDNLHAMCGLDLFTPELKNAYYSKLGDINRESSPVSRIPRVGEPLCGAYNQDVPSTLAGNWFSGNENTGSVTATQYQIALASTVVNAGIGEFSMQAQTELGGNIAVKFTPTHSGTINRQFSEVMPGEGVYCYQSTFTEVNRAKLDKSGKPIVPPAVKYLIKLTNATHISIEKQSGTCSASETLKNPFTYER